MSHGRGILPGSGLQWVGKNRQGSAMIDTKGYRANVGIVLTNTERRLFWCKRAGMNAWQFPQGGIRLNELVESAMYRELREETGLLPEHVEIVSCTTGWLHYRLPEKYIRRKSNPVCIGQKQRWYLLRLLVDESMVRLDVSAKPEFDNWLWIDFWKPVKEVVKFKRRVYKQALAEFEPILFPERRVSMPADNPYYSC
jgi:putative (di)nucleoside polyphosphate hydrolase